MPVLLNKFKGLFKGFNADDDNSDLLLRKQIIAKYIRYNRDPFLNWDIIGDLGDGAFGKVRKVKHKTEPNKYAAAKTIELGEQERLEDFLIEIEILSECQHRNVVGLYEAYFRDNSLLLFLEYCEAGALDSIMIELEKPLNEPQIRYVCHELCDALSFLHSRFVIHRDLKAGNILLTSDGQVKLADFGVSAKNKAANQKRDTFIGTPYWMAPEVMVCETFKDKPYDYKADIWSFGITLIELAQMEPPNHEMSAMRVLIKIQKSDPPKLFNPNKWSQEFSDFLTRCLKKSPDERLSARELLSHRFCSSSTNSRPMLELLSEARADVIEEQIEEIDDDNSLTSGSTPDNGELSTDGTDITDSSVRNITVNDDDQEPESVIVISTSNSTKTDDSGIGFENEHNITTTNGHSRVKTNFESSRSSSDDSKSSSSDHKNNDYDILHKRDQSCCSFGGDSVRLMADEILDSLYDSLTTEESRRKSETSNGGYTHATNPNVSRILIAVPESPEGAESIDDEKPEQQRIGDTDTQQSAYIVTDPAPGVENDVIFITSLREKPESNRDYQQANDSKKPVVMFRSLDALKEELPSTSSATQVDYGTSKSDEASDFKHRKSVHELKADFESRRKEMCNSTAEVSTACNAAVKKRRSLAFNASAPVSNPSSPPLPPPSHISSSPSLQFKQRASAIEHLLSKNISSNARINPPALSVSSDDRNLARRQHSLDSVASSNTSSSEHEGTTVSMRNPTVAPLIQQPKQLSARHTIVPAMRTVSPTHNPANEKPKTPDGVKMPPPEPPVDYDSRSGLPRTNKLVNASESKSSHVSQGLRRLDNDTKVNASKNIAEQTRKEARGRPLATNTNNDAAKIDNGKMLSSLEMSSNVNVVQVPNGSGANGLGERKNYARRTVTKKTRAYMVDGVPVTSTTYHLMSEDGSNNYKAKEDFQLRKSELQALKRLQKEEAHQFQDLAAKTETHREFQEKRFIQDMQSIQNHYDGDLELLSKQQKKQLEETERLQEEEFRMTVKRLKQEQDRDLRAFRETLKQEHKLLKHEMEIVPKADRKGVFRSRRDMLDVEHLERDRQFCEKQQQEYESTLARLKTTHIENVVALEKHFLEQKHKMMRTREKSLLDMEERQLHEKHQIAKSQLKEIFLLQRSQMLIRHQKELEHMKKLHMNKEDEYNRMVIAERKRLPKSLRADSKLRTVSFKELLRSRNLDALEISRQMRDFEEREQKRLVHEMRKQEARLKKRLEHLKTENEMARKELELMQNEKRKMLLEYESDRLSKLEGEYSTEMRSWRSQMKNRIQSMEEKFAQEIAEQEKFYDVSLPSTNSLMKSTSVSSSLKINMIK